MGQVTQILAAIERGTASTDDLLPLVYDELRSLAMQRLSHEKPGQTLQATALVHEVYLRLTDGEQAEQWNGKGHFFGAAAEAMRRILVERARRKGRIKHGGDAQRVDLDEGLIVSDETSPDVLALDEALAELVKHDAQTAQLVKLRYFAGLTHQQSAEALGITRRAADRLWTVARAWLYRRLTAGAGD